MPRIEHRRRRTASKRQLRPVYMIAGAIIGVLILANLLTFFIYRNRTYPNTQVIGAHVGNVSFSQLASKVETLHPLPKNITLQHGQARAVATASELGISQDASSLVDSAKKQRFWLPVGNFFTSHRLAAPIKIDTATLEAKAKQLDASFSTEPQNARLTLENGNTRLVPAVAGYRLDHSRLAQALQTGLSQGSATITAPVHEQAAQIQTKALEAQKQALDKQLNTALTIAYAGKTSRPSRADIARWYILSDQGFTASESNIISSFTELGVQANVQFSNSVSVAADTIRALRNGQPATINLATATITKTITYCTAVKGVSTAELPVLQAKARRTYADARGWSLSGIVAFKEVTSGCNFTLWLTAPQLMPTFGEICDSTWSCRVGPNVVINYDRWQHASPAWNQFGGTLDNYRDMVINHETGHWLGFGHASCPGPGQQAPVMQQQSIDLQGCIFSPWPSAQEQLVDRRNLGL